MVGASPPVRTESRVRERILVELYSFDNAAYEITSTVEVSLHGARVLTKAPWTASQNLSVRSIQGSLFSRARIIYCKPLLDSSFHIGLELLHPTGDWPTLGEPSGSPEPH